MCTSKRVNGARRLIDMNLLRLIDRFLTSKLLNCHRLVRHSYSLRNISGQIMSTKCFLPSISDGLLDSESSLGGGAS